MLFVIVWSPLSFHPGGQVRLSTDQVAPVLRFLAEISKEVKMKDRLGHTPGEATLWWPLLLHLLCMSSDQSNQKVSAELARNALF